MSRGLKKEREKKERPCFLYLCRMIRGPSSFGITQKAHTHERERERERERKSEREGRKR